MDAIEAIKTRRSIRHFTQEPVPESLIRELLEAAMFAPSAGNQQPWHFVVIDDEKLLQQIPTVHPYAAMVREARAAIAVCGNLQREKHQGFWVQDCSAACQNLLLAAHALGLGAVWLGVYPREERVKGLRTLLQLPEEIIPLALIPVGFPREEKGTVDRFDELKISWNQSTSR
jgi:nitroreductase